MNQPRTDDPESLVIVAHAVRVRGLKGELVAELLTDFPSRFADISSLIAVSPHGKRQPVRLESSWLQKDRIILKLEGVDSVEAAKEFVDFDFGVPEAERVELPEGHFYDWELEGCTVESVAGVQIGRVVGVMRLSGEIEMLAVEVNGQQRLVPMVDSIVTEVDIPGRKVRIDPPAGLLDL